MRSDLRELCHEPKTRQWKRAGIAIRDVSKGGIIAWVRTWRSSMTNWSQASESKRATYSHIDDGILNITVGCDRDPMAVAQNLKRVECQAHAHVKYT